MKYINLEDIKNIRKNDCCEFIDYPLDDKDLDGALIRINGRYPEEGKAKNTVCKELVYIADGNGKLYINDQIIDLKKDMIVLIDKNEEYVWEGNDLKLFVTCDPNWYIEQHEEIK